MAWTNNPYCAYSDVKTALGLRSDTDQAFVQTLIVQAQAYLDREIGFSFQTDGTVGSPATRLYSGNNTQQLMIDDCLSFSQILEVNYNVIFGNNGLWINGSATTIDITADVVLGPDNYPTATEPAYLLYRLSGQLFFRGRQNYKVFGVFGRPTTPSDIQRACIRLAAHYYAMRNSNYSDATSAENGGNKVYYKKQVPADVEEIICHYRRKIFIGGV